MENSGLITNRNVQKLIFVIDSIIHFKNTEYEWMKIAFVAKSRHNTSIITDFE